MLVLYFVLTLITGFGLGTVWGAYHHERYVVDEELEELIPDQDDEPDRIMGMRWSSRKYHHED